ncbi:calcium-translocating P-type ATPase, PMCA-type [Prevotella sp. A2931]|uniref:P-type Ca(2+) transporter n=2 Tax=Prevotellaceae TaxID=171552 RepID=A0ABS3M7B3_9BACT|nr:calcium-translocating P-type ATPase, PMCA-type [Prevotella illustrans]PTL27385.1 calcium-translocating P-type ATPase, PMCA-type [Prevotella sp. oral taxon 820]
MTGNHFLAGLSDDQVAAARARHGENLLTPPKKTSLWTLYFDKYNDPIIRILLVAAAISLAFAIIEQDFIETIGIFLAIFLATTIGFYFERDAARKFGMLTAMDDDRPVKVRRNGRVVEIRRRDVVVGDVVLIETGDEVPADGRLTQATDLQIDESSLTGEPIADKHAPTDEGETAVADEATYPADMVMRSTMVMSGRGEYVVTAVGDATEIGQVARKSTETTSVKTPLNMQLDRLAVMISKVGAGVAVAAFVLFLGHDILTDTLWHTHNYIHMAQTVLKYFMMAVTLIVMAVPEGLPMAVTLALALNMRRMLKSNNLVRKLHSCETMGAVTVICTDKTGTLTQNRMRVAQPAADKEGSDPLLDIAIALNSTAELHGREVIGNPTEGALLLWLQDRGVDYRALRQRYETTAREPFSTERKYMSTTAVVDGTPRRFVKGAPEIVIAMCDMSAEERSAVERRLSDYQHKAMRTLAFAVDDRFQQVFAISDPIRDEVPAAIRQCHDAGIEVKIVTGDTAATAAEIGRQIGVITKEESSLTPHRPSSTTQITGPAWAALSDDDAFRLAPSVKVMSRARPSDKQRLVEMLQRHGEIVAVTGDGTNDAPALHHAHVGLSLGSGTGVAKEASDMTLLDDSFGSIVNAVMWGRSLYKNIQRFLYFQLVVNLTALSLVLAGALVGTELPLTVTQILWVNLIMDTFAAMALASLPPSHEVMHEKPRNTADFILSSAMLRGIGLTGLAFFVALLAFLVFCEQMPGGMGTHELTLFFTTFVMLQFWNLLNAKCLGSHHSAFRRLRADRGLLLVQLIILGGQWLIVEFGGRMFRTDGMSAREWLVVVGATSAVLWLGEAWRWACRLLESKNKTYENHQS